MSSSYRNSRVRSGLRGVAQLAGAAALVCAATSASAANEWVFNPRVEVGAVYDDNYRLTDQPGQEIQVTGAALDAELAMRSESQRSLLELTPRVHSTFFPSASSEEATDGFLNARAERRTQRVVSRFDAQYANESVVSSELLAADFPAVGLGQIVSGDTGRVSVRNRRRLIVASPSLAYDWTERRHVNANLQYVDASYQAKLFEQIGYKDYAASAGIGWDVSQRHRFTLQAVGDRFSPGDGSEDTNTEGLQAEWRTATSAVTSYYFRAGARHSQRNGTATTAKVSSTSFNGGLGVAWQLQTTQLVIDALRDTVPSGAGIIVNRDELRFRLTRTFQPRFSGFLAVRGIRTTELANDSITAVRNRKYATGSTGFEWRANRQFSIAGVYEYQWQEFQGEPNDARSNGVNLSVVYEPRRLN
jgi:hypothetical protein